MRLNLHLINNRCESTSVATMTPRFNIVTDLTVMKVQMIWPNFNNSAKDLPIWKYQWCPTQKTWSHQGLKLSWTKALTAVAESNWILSQTYQHESIDVLNKSLDYIDISNSWHSVTMLKTYRHESTNVVLNKSLNFIKINNIWPSVTMSKTYRHESTNVVLNNSLDYTDIK